MGQKVNLTELEQAVIDILTMNPGISLVEIGTIIYADRPPVRNAGNAVRCVIRRMEDKGLRFRILNMGRNGSLVWLKG